MSYARGRFAQLILACSMLPLGPSLVQAQRAPAEPSAPNPARAPNALGSGDYQTTVRAHAEQPSSPPGSGFVDRVVVDTTRSPQSLVDVLAEVPGTQVRDWGWGQRKTISLRAAEPHQVAVYLDGIRLSDAGRGDVDLSLVDPFLLEAITVDRSGACRASGGTAIGGLLQLQSPKLGSQPKASAALSYGSWNTLRAGAALASGSPALRFLTSGSYQQTDGDFSFIDHNGQPQVRGNNDGRIGQGLFKLDYVGGERWQLDLLGHVSAALRGAPGMSQRPSDARQRDLQLATALRATRHQFILPEGRVELTLSQRYTQFRFEQSTLPAVETQNEGLMLGGRSALELPFGKHGALRGAFDLAWDRFDNLDSADPIADANRRLTTETLLGADWRLGSGHLALAAALRLGAASDFSPLWAPRLALSLRPLASAKEAWARGLELISTAARSYRFPTFDEMYLRVDGYLPNPDLRHEDAINLDAGVRWTLTAAAQLQAAYFQRWIDNVIIVAQDDSFRVQPDNYAGALARGCEGQLLLRPGAGLALQASYTFTTTRFGRPTKALPGHPQHQLGARLSWEGQRSDSQRTGPRPTPGASALGPTRPAVRPSTNAAGMMEPAPRRWLHGLRLWVALTAQGSMPLDRFNQTIEEGRALLSAGGSYSWRALTLSAEGQNLLDKRDAVDTTGFPLPPARFFVTLAARQ